MRSQFYNESKRNEQLKQNRVKGRLKQILKDRIDTIQHMIDITEDKEVWEVCH